MKRYSKPLLACAALLAFAGTLAQKSHDTAVNRNLTVFNALVKELELNYIDSIRTDEAFRDAIAAYVNTVDPYTEFYTPDDQEVLETMTTGEYGGIGSYIQQRKDGVYISEPYEDSPAALAGLMAGDRILMVDTVDCAGLNSTQVTKLLRGQPGVTINVKVHRPYAADSLLTIPVTRRKLSLPSVPYAGLIEDGKIGYVALSSFTTKSSEEVRRALEEFSRAPDLQGVVLDLRGNGGGLLNEAVAIVGNFVPKGTEVVRTRYKDGREQVYKTTKSPLLPDVPLAVLIDGGSASAAEITAGALQDRDRAVLLGTSSFGKGLVQSTRPLPYGGLLKVTIAKYYIPSGRLIQAFDYSHRNPDGTVGRVPDSLTHVFKTLHGREVRDGGGLQPDSLLSWGEYKPVVYALVTENKIFDYATRFKAGHPEIEQPGDFAVTDEIFADFKASLDPATFNYDKDCESLMKEVAEMAEAEGYMNDTTRAQIEALTKSLTHDLDHDLEHNRAEIERWLGSEIVTRYYYDRGKRAHDLKRDEGVKAAVGVLTDQKEYKRILNLK